MEKLSESHSQSSRSDDLAFIKLVIEVERLTREVTYLSHLLYVPNGGTALVPKVGNIESQLGQMLARQKWLQSIGGAILAGIIIQVVTMFLKK